MGVKRLPPQALQEGAASYVPKSQAKQLLVDNVNRVVSIVTANTEYDRLIDHATVTDFHFELINDVTLIPPLAQSGPANGSWHGHL